MTNATQPRLCLEDLEVGQIFASEEYGMSAAEITEFARRYDPQPFHVDEELAKNSFFQSLAASGWHTAAVTMRLLVQSVPIEGGIIGAGSDIAWPRATRPGDRLSVVSEITDISPSKSRPDRGIVTLVSETKNQKGEVCQRSSARLVVFRRHD